MEESLDSLKKNLVEAVEALNAASAPMDEKVLKVLHENVDRRAHAVVYRIKRDSE